MRELMGRLTQVCRHYGPFMRGLFQRVRCQVISRYFDGLHFTGWKHVRFFIPRKFLLPRDGMMLTLNGIAQGFIADKIATYFRRNGVENVLVNTGEISGLGMGPDGDFWRVSFDHVAGNKIALHNMSIATSAPLGTVFDGQGKVGHILDPRTGRPGGLWSGVSVIAATASEADGLSTAFSLMSWADIELAKGDAQVFVSV